MVHLPPIATVMAPRSDASCWCISARSCIADAAALALEPVTLNVHNAGNIESAIVALGRHPGGGLVVAPETFTELHRELIVTLVARHRVPTIYGIRQFAMSGGLVSYGPIRTDTFRRSASYVDRIFKGEKPGDLPVQAPTKYELVINLGTAKVLGLTVPPDLLVAADEVIE